MATSRVLVDITCYRGVDVTIAPSLDRSIQRLTASEETPLRLEFEGGGAVVWLSEGAAVHLRDQLTAQLTELRAQRRDALLSTAPLPRVGGDGESVRAGS